MKNNCSTVFVLILVALTLFIGNSQAQYSIIHKAIRINDICWILRSPEGAIAIDVVNNKLTQISGLDTNSIMEVCPDWKNGNDTIILVQEGKTCKFFKWNGKKIRKIKHLDIQLEYFEDVMMMVKHNERGYLVTTKRIIDIEDKKKDGWQNRFADPWVVVKNMEYWKEEEKVKDHYIRPIEAFDLGNYVSRNGQLIIASNMYGHGAIIRIDVDRANLSIDYLADDPVNDIIIYPNEDGSRIYYCAGNVHIATTSGLFGTVDESGKRAGSAIQEPEIAKALKLEENFMYFDEIPIYGMFTEGNELWAYTENGSTFRLQPELSVKIRIPEFREVDNIKYSVQADGAVLLDLSSIEVFDFGSRYLVAHKVR
jgi:hypothetical protein